MDIGARAVHEIMLGGYPETNLNILIVWLKMFDADSLEAAHEAAKLFYKDPRVSQFYDPLKVLGKEVATRLGAKSGEIAWDIYLFYDCRDEWIERLPEPSDWVHQLKGSRWAEPGRLFQGDELTRKLQEILMNLLQNQESA